jgi:hypothetical protein
MPGVQHVECTILLCLGAYLLKVENNLPSQATGLIALLTSFGLYVSDADSLKEATQQLWAR